MDIRCRWFFIQRVGRDTFHSSRNQYSLKGRKRSLSSAGVATRRGTITPSLDLPPRLMTLPTAVAPYASTYPAYDSRLSVPLLTHSLQSQRSNLFITAQELLETNLNFSLSKKLTQCAKKIFQSRDWVQSQFSAKSPWRAYNVVCIGSTANHRVRGVTFQIIMEHCVQLHK